MNKFLRACEKNDISIVSKLLSEGADVNWRTDDDVGAAGLHFAARDNYGELLELLLAQTGVNVNIRTNKNETPLMVACYYGHEKIVRRLCTVTDIQLNSRDDRGLTALHRAVDVDNNRPACVSVLRGVAGVDWNVRNNYGKYPLTQAVHRGNAESLQIILTVPEPHLDLSVTDSGINIAQIAVESNGGDRQRCLELLSGVRRVDWNINTQYTPVMHCLKNNREEDRDGTLPYQHSWGGS